MVYVMAQQSTYFENRAARLVDDARGFLRLIWRPNGYDVVERREIMEQTLAWLIETQHGRILADQRYMVPFSAAEQQWIQEHWYPRAIGPGNYRRRAVLLPHDAAARHASAAVTVPVRHQISYCNFDDEAEAIAWLLA
ncbi:hypothetical protein EJV47_16435 [Hymenobacter gummosus]|uniref:STAS/SEC14 domain-containing protein n=1 Tax=Hymenobacter gummosus TaxID=1776032 RepID=A0A3S0HM86_9BACT|nr:hypothetical protein [Hymenobacter gummosus]RTQ48559.1 hypothetical protein EJV47_16435 [Hymenobacter gummosus]